MLKILQTSPEEIKAINENFFTTLVDLMSKKDSEIYEPASRIVSQCFSLDEPRLIDISL